MRSLNLPIQNNAPDLLVGHWRALRLHLRSFKPVYIEHSGRVERQIAKSDGEADDLLQLVINYVVGHEKVVVSI